MARCQDVLPGIGSKQAAIQMKADLRLVRIVEADLDGVASLVNRAFARYSHISSLPRTSPVQYAEEAGPDARLILAEAGGRLIASSMIAPAERFIEDGVHCGGGSASSAAHPGESASHPWAGALYFGLAAVEPECMSRGLGRRLVEFAGQVAAEEGYRGIGLGTLREFGLVPYYEKLDYRLVSEEPYPAGHWDFLIPHNYCEMVKLR